MFYSEIYNEFLKGTENGTLWFAPKANGFGGTISVEKPGSGSA